MGLWPPHHRTHDDYCPSWCSPADQECEGEYSGADLCGTCYGSDEDRVREGGRQNTDDCRGQDSILRRWGRATAWGYGGVRRSYSKKGSRAVRRRAGGRLRLSRSRHSYRPIGETFPIATCGRQHNQVGSALQRRLRQSALPSEVADAVYFFSGSENSCITASQSFVDSGLIVSLKTARWLISHLPRPETRII